MNISAVAITERGIQLADQLNQKSDGTVSSFLCSEADLSAWIEKYISSLDALILICSADIAVSAISRYIKKGVQIPSVIVLDESEKYAIPIVSGTLGLANDIANALSTITDCIPVLTSASNSENVFSIDKWANSVGLKIANPENIKFITSKLISGEIVHFESIFPLIGEPPKGIELSSSSDASDFAITFLTSVPEKTLHLVPPVLTLGIDCQKDKNCDEIETAYTDFLRECGCHPLAVREVCTFDLENQSPALLEFCTKNKLPYKVFNADELLNSNYLSSTSENEKICEQCAVLGSNGTLFVRKMVINNISFALAIIEPN